MWSTNILHNASFYKYWFLERIVVYVHDFEHLNLKEIFHYILRALDKLAYCVNYENI